MKHVVIPLPTTHDILPTINRSFRRRDGWNRVKVHVLAPSFGVVGPAELKDMVSQMREEVDRIESGDVYLVLTGLVIANLAAYHLLSIEYRKDVRFLVYDTVTSRYRIIAGLAEPVVIR